MVATHPTLPTEVVRLALEAAYLTPDTSLWDDYGRELRVAWFAGTLRVSRTWYSAGRQALYYHIQVVTQNERSNVLLARTLSQKPHVAQLVKILHVQTSANCQWRCRKRITMFPTPSIPIVTRKGRKKWRRQQHDKKLAQLLGLCVGLTELSVEEPDLALAISVLDSMEINLYRLVIKRAHDVHYHQWERLARSTFWHNLRSIQLYAINPHISTSLYESIFGLDAAFLDGAPFPRLKTLEVVGCVNDLRTIIDVVRPTLKTLHCDQAVDTAEMGLPLVRDGLQTLSLSVWPPMPLADLSSFSRLEHLTIDLMTDNMYRPGGITLIPPQNIPPSISAFQLKIPERFNPWCAASDVAQVLHAFDVGLLPNLRDIIVSVEMDVPDQINAWTPAIFLLASIVKRRGLELRVDVRLKLGRPDLYKFDCFARVRYEQEKAREAERARKVERRGPPGLGSRVLDGLLTTAAHAYLCLCCVMYTSCCCCCLARYFD